MSNYFTYWHISAPVFIRPADTAALYQSTATKNLTSRLQQFAETHQTLALLTGAPGSGKTTILRWLASAIPMKTHDIFLTTLLSRELTGGWLLPRIAGYFKSGQQNNEKDWTAAICTGFDQLSKEGRHLVVCADASHLICTDEAMADLEAFFNLQELTDPRVSIVLAGNQELAERIRKYAPLALRVSTFLETEGLQRHELDEYIELRLKQAGITVTFDPEALSLIFRHCDGNFLTANVTLEKCLIEAAARQSRRITTFIAEHAIQSMLQKQDPVSQSTLAGLSADRDRFAAPAPVSPSKQPEHFEKKIRADQHGLSKNENEKSGSIKLSSLFKQDDE